MEGEGDGEIGLPGRGGAHDGDDWMLAHTTSVSTIRVWEYVTAPLAQSGADSSGDEMSIFTKVKEMLGGRHHEVPGPRTPDSGDEVLGDRTGDRPGDTARDRVDQTGETPRDMTGDVFGDRPAQDTGDDVERPEGHGG
jgi:hypothetical protein